MTRLPPHLAAALRQVAAEMRSRGERFKEPFKVEHWQYTPEGKTETVYEMTTVRLFPSAPSTPPEEREITGENIRPTDIAPITGEDQ